MKEMRNGVDMRGRQYTQEKEKKSYMKIIIIVLIIIIIISGIWMWNSNRGTWVCENGEWIMQGKTSDSKPTGFCNGDGETAVSAEIEKPDEKMVELDSKKVAEGIDIRVMTPHVNATVESSLEITGEAKDWYVDDEFLIELINKEGAILGFGTAKAKESVDSEKYIKFDAKIKFDEKDAKSGDLIFYRSDPTGKSKNIGTFSFPVFFE